MYLSQQIAADAVNQVLLGRNLTLALPAALARFPQATQQQRGAAQDLSYGTVRFYGEIDAYLVQLLQKPLTDQRINALLLVAIYQLLHDKADAFTVVDQAVKAVSQLKKPAAKSWAKGLVNAILRNFLRQKAALVVKVEASEAATYAYPQWWISKLKHQYPSHWQAMLEAGNGHPPMTLRVNTQKVSIDHYVQLLAQQGIEAAHIGMQAVVLSKPISVEKIPAFDEGWVSVQDLGAQLAAYLLDAKAGMRVLDACAAPGGKTSHIVELADVRLTALDVDAVRLQKVKSNLDRLQLSAQLLVGDASSNAWQGQDAQHFDRILADVPCSASGIVRRHVDIKYLRRAADIASFAHQQAKILANLWQMLAKGGKLLYVTCSVFNEENQAQVDQFLQNNVDATQLPFELPFASAVAKNTHIAHNAPIAETLEIVQINGQLISSKAHDGFFYALLQKN